MKYVFAFVTTLGILSTITSPMAMTMNGTTEPTITAVEHPFEVAPNVPTPRSSNRVGPKKAYEHILYLKLSYRISPRIKPYMVTRTFGSYGDFFISIEGGEGDYFEYRFEHAYKDIQSLDHLTPEYKKLFT